MASTDSDRTQVGTDEDGVRELVATAGRVLHQQGLADYLGHTSARTTEPDRFVVKPKHSARIRGMHSLVGDQMAVVDADGRLLEGNDPPPAEVFIHTEIYRARPEVMAVVHTHQPAATLMGVLGAPIRPVLHVQSTFVHSPVPIWDCPLLVTSSAMGADLATALGGQAFCHLQGHGIVSVAESVEAAVVGAVMLEQLAAANLAILQTGLDPRDITTEEIAQLTADKAPVAGRWAYLTQLLDSTTQPAHV